MAKKNIVFIINPISGTGKQNGIEKKIYRFLEKKTFNPTFYYSEYAGHLKTLTQKAIGKNYEYIVSVGGDGSVNEVFQNIVNQDAVMGILPSGSGNGLARHLKIPIDLNKSIQLLNHLITQKIDTAEMNSRPFISIAGVGFDAYIAKLFKESKKRGFWSYFKIVLKSYLKYGEETYQLKIDNGDFIKVKALMICFANSNQFGNNVQIAPQANISDGFIDICIVKKVPLWAIPMTAFLLFTKKIEKSKYYQGIKGRELILNSKNELDANIDGESVKMGNELKLKIKPLSLNIICPK